MQLTMTHTVLLPVSESNSSPQGQTLFSGSKKRGGKEVKFNAPCSGHWKNLSLPLLVLDIPYSYLVFVTIPPHRDPTSADTKGRRQ